METQQSDEARIARMLKEGKLTADEANRLRQSVQSQRARDAMITGPLRRRDPARRRLIRLLILCAVFFVIGVVGGAWWYPAPDVAGSAVSAQTNQQPQGRVIDLSALDEERSKTMRGARGFSSTIFVLVIVAVVGVAILLIYNALVDAREKVNAGWAQVENQYQRRLDLVPVLIDGVKTYMDHERETLTALTEARAHALGVNSALSGGPPETTEQLRTLEAAQGRVQSALARLFAVVENYPDLKASQNFLTLQDQIEGTENRIAIERRSYNEWSRRYNTRTLKFPFNVIADLLGFESKPYFQAETAALESLKDPFGRNQK